MSHIFLTPRRVITGIGSFNDLGAEAARLARSVLVVTGRHAMRAAGITQRAERILRDAGVAVHLFEDAPPEPDTPAVDRARAARSTCGAEAVIGIGGGSALDVAKAAAALANETAPTDDFLAGRAIAATGVPLIAVPTTAGTGTEATLNAVLTDSAGKVKKSIRHESLLPAAAIVDAELTVTCPPNVTAWSGMDALTQAIESFISVGATPVTEPLSLQGVKLLSRHLERAVVDGRDLAARDDCACGSLVTGLAFATARLGVVHGLAHPIGVRYHVPHGLVCGVLLRHALRLNRPVIGAKYGELCQAAGGDIIDFVTNLGRRIGLPNDLSSYGLRPGGFPAIIAESMPSGSLKSNPKKITEDDMRWLLDNATGSVPRKQWTSAE